jgi:imidazoleglycerol phosphate synthase glutamine amidotransferase subunit HisH
LIIRIIFGEDYRSLTSSLCSFLHSLSPRPSEAQIVSSSNYNSQTHSAYVRSSMWATTFHTHTKQQAKL